MVVIFYAYLSISGRLLVMLLSLLLLWSQNATLHVNVSVGFGCESLFETVRSDLPFFAHVHDSYIQNGASENF